MHLGKTSTNESLQVTLMTSHDGWIIVRIISSSLPTLKKTAFIQGMDWLEVMMSWNHHGEAQQLHQPIHKQVDQVIDLCQFPMM